MTTPCRLLCHYLDSGAEFFLATIWPLIQVLRSPVSATVHRLYVSSASRRQALRGHVILLRCLVRDRDQYLRKKQSELDCADIIRLYWYASRPPSSLPSDYRSSGWYANPYCSAEAYRYGPVGRRRPPIRPEFTTLFSYLKRKAKEEYL